MTRAHAVDGRLLRPVMFSRVLADTSNQLFNPFLGAIAIGLGLTVPQLGLLLGLRSLSGLTGPLLGSVGDRWGALRVAKVGIVLMATGLLLLALSRGLYLTLLGMVAMGVALGVINPALQAHVGAVVEFRRRAKVLSVIEYSWALAGIIGLAACGWSIAVIGWRATVALVAALLLSSLLGLNRLAPAPADGAVVLRAQRARLTPAAKLGALAVALLFFSMFNVTIVHGVWLTDAFGLGPEALGLVSLALGIADLAGAASVSLIAGRVSVGVLASTSAVAGAAVYLGLGFAAGSLAAALSMLAATRALMQVGFVSMLTLLSEVSPTNRALVMTSAAAAGQVGMAAAAIMGPWSYATLGLTTLGAVSGTSLIGATVVIQAFDRRFRRERGVLA